MIMKCVRDMDKYRAGTEDKITLKQLTDEGHPQCIIDYCFKAVPEMPTVVRLPIIDDSGRLGCWVPGNSNPAIFGDTAVQGMKRWLPLATIPGLTSFSHWSNNKGAWTEAGINGRMQTDTSRSAGWAEFAVFAAKE